MKVGPGRARESGPAIPPGEITKDGKPIVGGTDIDKLDYAFAASVYPKKVTSIR